MEKGEIIETLALSGPNTMASDEDTPFSKRVMGVEDGISQLPDSLLIHILSLLPTKVAFRTCVLSKRWQYLSTLLDNFIFTRKDFRTMKDFVSFVDYALAHSLSPKVKKFHLNCNKLNYDKYNSHICRWLSFAVERKVEDVFLYVDFFFDASTLPESLWTCSSLITLYLVSCCFDDKVVIDLKSLKSITLEYSKLEDRHVVNLLSGCPALDYMELFHPQSFRRLVIRSLNLKSLILDGYHTEERDQSLEIIAPYLQHLKISGNLYDLKCRLVEVSSLVTANLTFYLECIKEMLHFYHDGLPQLYEVDDEGDSCHDYHQAFTPLVHNYLQKLSGAIELTIGTWLTEVICMLQLEGVQIPELKCKFLTIELHLKRSNLYGVVGLLQASPQVEILNIHMNTVLFGYSRCQFDLRHLAKGDDIDLQSWNSRFEFPNLKNVKIVISFEESLKDHFKWGFDRLFKLSECLLKSAKVLEKFVIISERRKCKKCSSNCVSQYFFRLTEKLLGCPRSSTNSMIIIFQK